jgi:hypothetical protein
MAVAQNAQQPHNSEPVERRNAIKDKFMPPIFYCVETVCAPCGVTIACAKFAKS